MPPSPAGPGELPVVLMVNGVVAKKPVDGATPLTEYLEQVAEQFPRAAELGIDHVVWNMPGGEPILNSPR